MSTNFYFQLLYVQLLWDQHLKTLVCKPNSFTLLYILYIDIILSDPNIKKRRTAVSLEQMLRPHYAVYWLRGRVSDSAPWERLLCRLWLALVTFRQTLQYTQQ